MSAHYQLIITCLSISHTIPRSLIWAPLPPLLQQSFPCLSWLTVWPQFIYQSHSHYHLNVLSFHWAFEPSVDVWREIQSWSQTVRRLLTVQLSAYNSSWDLSYPHSLDSQLSIRQCVLYKTCSFSQLLAFESLARTLSNSVFILNDADVFDPRYIFRLEWVSRRELVLDIMSVGSRWVQSATTTAAILPSDFLLEKLRFLKMLRDFSGSLSLSLIWVSKPTSSSSTLWLMATDVSMYLQSYWVAADLASSVLTALPRTKSVLLATRITAFVPTVSEFHRRSRASRASRKLLLSVAANTTQNAWGSAS